MPPKKVKVEHSTTVPTAQAPAAAVALAVTTVDAIANAGTTNTDGNVYGWMVEYAKSGRSKCGVSGTLIPEGAVRIGKEVDSTFKLGTKMWVYHLVEPLFASFHKGNSGKNKVHSSSDLVGFESLRKTDQDSLAALITEQQTLVATLNEADSKALMFENTSGEKNKWWSILVVGASTRVKWGLIGEEDNNLSEKQHADEAAAEKFKEKMIMEKTTKAGYVLKKTT